MEYFFVRYGFLAGQIAPLDFWNGTLFGVETIGPFLTFVPTVVMPRLIAGGDLSEKFLLPRNSHGEHIGNHPLSRGWRYRYVLVVGNDRDLWCDHLYGGPGLVCNRAATDHRRASASPLKPPIAYGGREDEATWINYCIA